MYSLKIHKNQTNMQQNNLCDAIISCFRYYNRDATGFLFTSQQTGSIHTLSSRCQPPFTVYMRNIKVNWISLVCKMNWNWLSHSLSFCCGCFDHQIGFTEHRAPVGYANLLCFSAERYPPLRSIRNQNAWWWHPKMEEAVHKMRLKAVKIPHCSLIHL